jgi:hypothetical protein
MRRTILLALMSVYVVPRLALAQCGGVERWAVKMGADADAARASARCQRTASANAEDVLESAGAA